MNTLAIKSTYFPENRPSINQWFRMICGKDLNLDIIDTESIFGMVVVEGYKKDPDQTMKEIREAYRDNPAMVAKIIGEDNVKLIK